MKTLKKNIVAIQRVHTSWWFNEFSFAL